MVSRWLPLLGDHGRGLMNYFFRNLHLQECQLDDAIPTKGPPATRKKWKPVIA